ncbi:MAG: histidine--tRNA ligase [Candidatus Harrisonbacteria bacterium]|nr:histidine--tRNA ligase [Candidatus Harrisonbacteria bacterium]
MSKSARKKEVLQSVRGMHDILPEDQMYWTRAYETYKEVASYYNFQHIDTPLVEERALFERSNDQSEMVQKEMYLVSTGKNKQPMALRPEGTAGVARAYIEHGMKKWPHPVKLAYYGPFFRHDKPQLGRYRQFFQAGFEIFSSTIDPIYDAQSILASYRFIEALKIKGVSIHINTIGTPKCRQAYLQKLKAFFKSNGKKLTADQKKQTDENPLRLLDSKEKNIEEMRSEAPNILDHLDGDSKDHFMEVLEYLEDLSLPYTLDHTLVRGLDYYSHTVFEFVLDRKEGEEGLNLALGGGGRYDYLVELLGGRATPAVGSAPGVSRIVDVMKRRQLVTAKRPQKRVFLIHIGELPKKKSLTIIEDLRRANVAVTEALGKASLGAQLKSADKEGSAIALIFGQKEAYENSIIIRDMKTGAQETVPLDKVAKVVKKRM